MLIKDYCLIRQEKTSIQEVVEQLLKQKSGTAWAQKTNGFAITYAEDLTKVYLDSWYKGLLPVELFLHILLPKHEHMIKQDGSFIFPLDTPLSKALDFYKGASSVYAKECLNAIQYLKNEIQKNGFIFPIVLVVINDTLKHVDGLHRMLALKMLLDEGYEYKPLPVYLCDATK